MRPIYKDRVKPHGLLKAYLDSGASQYAGMLGFSLFVSILPLATGVLTVWGLIAQDPERFAAGRQLLVDVFPPEVRPSVRHALLAAGENAWAVGLLSVLGLIWFSTGLFSTAGFALNQIQGLPNRAAVKQRLLGLWLPLALAVTVNVAVGVSILIRAQSLPGWLGAVVIWLSVTYLVYFLYRYAPSRTPTRAQAVPGAVLAATVIVALAYGLPLLGRLVSQLGSETRFFATSLGLVTWVYLIAQAILIGAVFNREWRSSPVRSRPSG